MVHEKQSPLGQFDVGAVGHAVIPVAQLTGLRRQPPPVPECAGAALALRQADEHTLVALEAVLNAIRSGGKEIASYRRWGVLVSSCYPGRVASAHMLHRFMKLGPTGVSPMVPATQSLHSAAGTLSVTLNLRGPSFGVCGARNYVAEGMLAGCSFQDVRLAPGMFVVLTTSDPELLPNRQGTIATPDSQMYGVALAISASALAAPVLQLSVRRPADPVHAPSPMNLRALMAFLRGNEAMLTVPIDSNATMELHRAGAARRAA